MKLQVSALFIVTVFFSFSQITHATEIPDLFKKQSQLKCQASRITLGEKSPDGEVEVNFDSQQEELLIDANFLADKTKNFKIGRHFSAGKDFTNSTEFKCKYFYYQVSPTSVQAKYVCNDLEEPSIINPSIMSSFFLIANFSNGAICKVRGMCWELTNCK